MVSLGLFGMDFHALHTFRDQSYGNEHAHRFYPVFPSLCCGRLPFASRTEEPIDGLCLFRLIGNATLIDSLDRFHSNPSALRFLSFRIWVYCSPFRHGDDLYLFASSRRFRSGDSFFPTTCDCRWFQILCFLYSGIGGYHRPSWGDILE